MNTTARNSEAVSDEPQGEGGGLSLAAQVWWEAYRAPGGQQLLQYALELTGAAARVALMDMGCTVEPVMNSILVPVGRIHRRDRFLPECCSRVLSVIGGRRDVAMDGPLNVVDVIALPLNGERPLSLTGETACVGDFTVGEDNKCRLVTDGLAWLKRHAARAEALCSEWPDQLAGFQVALPDSIETLIVDRTQLQWRVAEPGCVLPPKAAIACADSREFAAWLAQETRRREPGRKAPVVMGPKMEAKVGS